MGEEQREFVECLNCRKDCADKVLVFNDNNTTTTACSNPCVIKLKREKSNG